ncbi:MAG: hypothetical protein ACYCW6_01250 [Candidatus Xenobia bacterium]
MLSSIGSGLSRIRTFFKADAAKEEFVAREDSNNNAMIVGAAVGGGVGALTGGVLGYHSAQADINKLPVNSTPELHWQTPQEHTVSIGRIPNDYYTPNNVWGAIGTQNGTHEVTANAPVTNPDGSVVMDQHSQAFTAHGHPIVNWQSNPIQQPYLPRGNEFTTQQFTDSHTVQDQPYTDQQGVVHQPSHEVVDGTWTRYYPNTEYRQIGSYQTPDVRWDTGVSTGTRTFVGILLGSVTGAVGGALAGVAVKKFTEK